MSETMNGEATAVVTEVTVAKRIEQYVVVRDKIEEIKKRQAEELKPYNETLDMLQGWLLNHLEKNRTDSAKTKAGTAYVSIRYTASLADPDQFMKFVITNGKFELMDRRANATACKDYVQETGALPPGVNLNGIKTIGVRRPPKLPSR